MEKTELFDRVVALAILVCFFPVWCFRALLGLLSGPLFLREPYIGKGKQSFNLLVFNGPLPGKRLAALFNIANGQLGFVGPALRPSTMTESTAETHEKLFSVRPGLVSPADIKRRLGMDHDGQVNIELEWIDRRSIKSNTSLLARQLVSRILYGSSKAFAPESLQFFGINILNSTMDTALSWIEEKAKSRPCSVLAFVNPHCLNLANEQSKYHDTLLKADCVLPDGSGISLGCRIQRVRLKGNLNGTDLFPLLCEQSESNGQSLYLLGGGPGIARLTADNMIKRFPDLKIAGVRDGFFSESDHENVIKDINSSGADILLVAMGVPKQELWIEDHRDQIEVGLAMGVGGLFDFYSGRIPRAPMWLREIGMEWTWRLLQEPKRMWKRYIIGNPLFIWSVWKETRQTK